VSATAARQPNWDIDRLEGEAGEHAVAQMLRSDNIEVKYDRRAQRTGQLFVETDCRYKTGWGPSGINKTKADTWFFVLDLEEKVTISVSTARLRSLVEKYRNSRPLSMNRGSHHTLGVGIPLSAITKPGGKE